MGLFWGSESTSTSSGGGSMMVTAEQMRGEFTDHMDRKGLKYSVLDESDNIVLLFFGGKKYDTYVVADFDESTPCDTVHFSSPNFATCSKSNLPALFIKLNELNRRFRWVKFWVNDEGSLTADTDAYIERGTVGEECMYVILRVSNILEDALESMEGLVELDKSTGDALRMAGVLRRFT